MTERLRVKVLVLGAGPGGYVAAIRAGQLGLDTVLVDADRLGGTCLIRGCIPSKAFIHAASECAAIRRAQLDGGLGLRVRGELEIDLAETVRWKDGIVDRLSNGVASLLKRAKVRVVAGWATFSDAKTCRVESSDGSSIVIEAENVVLAAGSEPAALESLPWSTDVISSTEALALDKAPERLAVVGAGYIGLELGMAFAKLGSKVFIIEAQGKILPQYDDELTLPVAKALERDGVEVRLGARALGFAGGRLRVLLFGEDPSELVVDKVLVTVGRRPRTAGWGLEAMAIDLAGPFIAIDNQCRTSVRNVWAIGDLVGEPMLAHKASAQGEMVAEIIAGGARRFAPAVIPAVCFTQPEIVTVGSADVTDNGVRTSVFPLSANGRSLSMEADQDGGFVRVTWRTDDNRVLAFSAVGRHVSELSGEMTALLEMGAVLEDVAAIIHAHPTQSEMLQEAALRGLGHAIHI